MAEEREDRERLDRAMVARDLARSRGQARDLIRSGAVLVEGHVVTKPAYAVAATTRIGRSGPGARWVGRGAEKLLAATQRWVPRGLRVAGAHCVDVGASTGGFTQVLLGLGARDIIAIDVGTGQLAQPVASDPRVWDLSQTHVLRVDAATVRAPVDLVVVDVSFISLCTVVPHLAPWCGPAGSMILLVKPQFEVGRSGLTGRGIVRSSTLRGSALGGVLDAVYDSGLALCDATPSPVTGAGGNLEYLLWVRPGPAGMMERAAALALSRTLT